MSTQDVLQDEINDEIKNEIKDEKIETMAQNSSEFKSKAGEGLDFEKMTSKNQELRFPKDMFTDDEMRELELVNEDGEYTNLGLLFSEQCPYGVNVFVYDGVSRGKLKASAEFGGPIFRQIQDVVDFAPDDWDRFLKDVLVNAVIRRNFMYPGHMQVHIFDDRVEVISMGYLANNFKNIRNVALYIALRRVKLGVQKCKCEFLASRGAFMLVVKKGESPAKELSINNLNR